VNSQAPDQSDTYGVAAARAWAAAVHSFWKQLRASGMPPREALACTVAMIRAASPSRVDSNEEDSK